jgi:hypothetical protein
MTRFPLELPRFLTPKISKTVEPLVIVTFVKIRLA